MKNFSFGTKHESESDETTPFFNVTTNYTSIFQQQQSQSKAVFDMFNPKQSSKKKHYPIENIQEFDEKEAVQQVANSLVSEPQSNQNYYPLSEVTGEVEETSEVSKQNTERQESPIEKLQSILEKSQQQEQSKPLNFVQNLSVQKSSFQLKMFQSNSNSLVENDKNDKKSNLFKFPSKTLKSSTVSEQRKINKLFSRNKEFSKAKIQEQKKNLIILEKGSSSKKLKASLSQKIVKQEIQKPKSPKVMKKVIFKKLENLRKRVLEESENKPKQSSIQNINQKKKFFCSKVQEQKQKSEKKSLQPLKTDEKLNFSICQQAAKRDKMAINKQLKIKSTTKNFDIFQKIQNPHNADNAEKKRQFRSFFQNDKNQKRDLSNLKKKVEATQLKNNLQIKHEKEIQTSKEKQMKVVQDKLNENSNNSLFFQKIQDISVEIQKVKNKIRKSSENSRNLSSLAKSIEKSIYLSDENYALKSKKQL